MSLIAQRGAATVALEKVDPGKSTCPDVAELLGSAAHSNRQVLVLATDETNEQGEIVKTTIWLLLVRGDHDLNEVKAGKLDWPMARV